MSPLTTQSLDSKLSVFPVFMKVEDRFAVVVGEGEEALAKARLLSESRVTVRLIAASPSADLSAFVEQGGLDHFGIPFTPEHLDGAALVFAATGDADHDEAIIHAARVRNIPANAVDRPELCDFYTPALVNRAPVAIAIGSQGSGPVLTQILRSQIEALLPASTGRLARLASIYRGTVEKLIPPGAARRRFWRSFFTGPVARSVDGGDISAARREASRLLKASGTETGHVSLVGAGPGAHDLLTLRAQRVMQEADVILYDALVPETLVAMGRRDARRVAVGKVKGLHFCNQEEINALLVAEAQAGRRVVRLKSGDPLVFGRAGEEMDALREHGIAFEIVPGVTSALAAAAEAQIPLTLRGVASSLVFATGHDRDGATLPEWGQLALNGATVAVYMGRTVAAQVAGRLHDAGLPASTPVAIIESASTENQRVYSGSLEELQQLPAGRSSQGPALILIGEALGRGSLDNAEPLFVLKSQETLAA